MRGKNSNPIDFVITWVDGNDEEWRKEKNIYSSTTNNDNSDVRYRDWDLLKYWFRGVEQFAPWVNKIYFVTWGHTPEWLNKDSEKLVIVNHKDYIPAEFLPTFSSHTIELNLHRIKDLSNNFVYFNDDMFLLDNVKETDFFFNDMPCDSAALTAYVPKEYNDLIILCCNMVGIINQHFDKKKQIKSNFFKWFNLKNGNKLLRTLIMNSWPNFSGFYEVHTPNSYNKSTFEKVWKYEKAILEFTSKEKFRNLKTHVNQWLFRYWQLAEGNFHPRRIDFGKYFDLGMSNFEEIINCIIKQKKKIVCLNDSTEIEDFDTRKKMIIESFEHILPEKSSFEK